MCRKIGCNRNVRNRVNKTEFGRIVLNLILYFGSKTKIKVVAITFICWPPRWLSDLSRIWHPLKKRSWWSRSPHLCVRSFGSARPLSVAGIEGPPLMNLDEIRIRKAHRWELGVAHAKWRKEVERLGRCEVIRNPKSLWTGNFQSNHLLRRTIKVFNGERAGKGIDVVRVHINHQINIIGQSGFTIYDAGDSACNHVGNGEFI